MTTVRELFEKMPEHFKKDAAKGMNAVYQFDITGEGGGKWYAKISNGELNVIEGEYSEPDLTVTMNAKDYIDMAEGKLNGMAAFTMGKLKIKGDMLLAMKMATIFSLT